MAERVDTIIGGMKRRRVGISSKPLRDFTEGDLLRLARRACVVFWIRAAVAFFVCFALLRIAAALLPMGFFTLFGM